MQTSYYKKLESGIHGPRCAGCRAYNEPGKWSSLCRKGHADWMHDRSAPIARADNRCDRFEVRVAEPASPMKEAA